MKKFEISEESLRSLLTAQFVKSLEREGDDVKMKMHIIHIHSMPDGTEKGKFLVVDFEGKCLQVLLFSELISR